MKHLDRHHFVWRLFPEPGLELVTGRHHLGRVTANICDQLQDPLLLQGLLHLLGDGHVCGGLLLGALLWAGHDGGDHGLQSLQLAGQFCPVLGQLLELLLLLSHLELLLVSLVLVHHYVVTDGLCRDESLITN